MGHQYSSFDCTSAGFEKEVIYRFRSLVAFLPQSCKVFREPWEYSTVLCLDFVDCPQYLEAVKQQSHLLVVAAKDLGLANAIVFRVGNKFMGWMRDPSVK
jgi:hypothetical protein